MSERVGLLVLGLGNVLLRDDGVGSAAIARLRAYYDAPGDVRVLDGGTLGLALLPYLQEAEQVILVDAIRSDEAPGSLVRIDGEMVAPAVATRLSPHQIGVSDLLDGARWLDRYPSDLVLLGIVPSAIDLAVGLSPGVAQTLPALVERVVDEARRLGFRFTRRRHTGCTDETPSAMAAVDVARPGWLR
jgi:hydrogenase maturation protease